MTRRWFLALVSSALTLVVGRRAARAADPRPKFPLSFPFANYSYPAGWDIGGPAPCGHACPICDAAEGTWRNAASNTTATKLQVSDATVNVGAVWPRGSGTVVFPNAVVTPAEKLAFLQTVLPVRPNAV